MKVLYFTNLPVPYRMDFFNQLGKLCELCVWVETDKRKKSNEAWLKRNKAEKFSFFIMKKFKLSDSKYINYGYIKKLINEKFDIVVVGTYYSLSAMLFIETLRILKIPYILNSDGGFVRLDSKLKKWIKMHFIKGANGYLSTGFLTDQYLEYYGADKKSIYRYPFTSVFERDILNYVTTEKEKIALREKLGMKERQIVVSVGSCIRRKGYDVLIEACNKIEHDVGFYLIGGKSTDDQLENLKHTVLEQGMENVHFIEFLNKNELSKYYRAADLFVLPTREDIWGLVINEAMAYGLPVITTNKCIAGTELVKNGYNGYIVPIEDAQALAIAIKRVLGNEKYKEIMSINSLQTARNYSIEKMALAHLDAFNDVLKNIHKETNHGEN